MYQLHNSSQLPLAIREINVNDIQRKKQMIFMNN